MKTKCVSCNVCLNHDNYGKCILKIDNTYVEETSLNAEGKVDYEKPKPVLFEFPTYSYMKTGDILAKCLTIGKK